MDALHRGLAALARDPALRLRLSDWGRGEARRYDCRAVAPRLIEVYEEAILRRRGRLADARRGKTPAWAPQTVSRPVGFAPADVTDLAPIGASASEAEEPDLVASRVA